MCSLVESPRWRVLCEAHTQRCTGIGADGRSDSTAKVDWTLNTHALDAVLSGGNPADETGRLRAGGQPGVQLGRLARSQRSNRMPAASRPP